MPSACNASTNAIFISYRRSDSANVTGRMCDHFKSHFGADAVFMDVDSIPLGIDFPKYLQQAVDSCKVLLAVIGPAWLEEFNSRLETPSTDWVRSEIARALHQNIRIIPVLVGGAHMPAEDALPTDLQAVRRLNAAQARVGSDFDHDMVLLIRRLSEIIGIQIPARLSTKQMKDLQTALLSAVPDEDSLSILGVMTAFLQRSAIRVKAKPETT